MKIRSIESMIVDIPIKRPAKMSFATVQSLEYVLIKIQADNGVTGFGESATIAAAAWSSESAESVKLTVDRILAPSLIGEDPRHFSNINNLMDKRVVGNLFAKSSIEMAVIDLVSRTLEVPAHQLLGGLYRDRIPCAWTLATGDTDRDIAEAHDLLDSGRHHIFKIKVGADTPKNDLDRVIKIRERLPDHASIRIDVNQAWDEQTARRCCRILDEHGIDLVEQPVISWNHEAMRRLKSENHLHIMADEGLTSIQSAMELIQNDAVDVLSLKLNKSGGLWNTRKISAIAEAAGIACYGGSMLETSLGTSAALHLYASLPNITVGCELFCPLFLTESITLQTLRYENGDVILPSGPGFGMELDEDKIKALRRD